MVALRHRGHDGRTTRDAGRDDRALPDGEVLAFATSEGRAVVTLNRRDFIRLHATMTRHAGIIVCGEDRDHERLAARIDAALAGREHVHGELVRAR